jgi:hypothetical protein
MPESAAVFDAAMTSISTLESKAVVAAYDFSGINTLVDVGGGHGLMIVTILKAYRRMRGILFDLSHVTAGEVHQGHRIGSLLRRCRSRFCHPLPRFKR